MHLSAIDTNWIDHRSTQIFKLDQTEFSILQSPKIVTNKQLSEQGNISGVWDVICRINFIFATLTTHTSTTKGQQGSLTNKIGTGGNL